MKLKKLSIVRQILLVKTSGHVKGTVWRTCILMLWFGKVLALPMKQETYVGLIQPTPCGEKRTGPSG